MSAVYLYSSTSKRPPNPYLLCNNSTAWTSVPGVGLGGMAERHIYNLIISIDFNLLNY